MSKAIFYVFVCFFMLHVVECRGRSYLQYDDLVSDGMNFYHDVYESDTTYIKQLKQVETTKPTLTTMTNSTEEICEHMYGFLPCSSNLLGHLFQIVVYEYLLFLGERYVTEGSELVFQILPGIFGASVFEILGGFPEAMILIVSGLSKSKEIAEEKVLTGVGLLAVSTVLLLTLVWGTCVIVGKNEILPGDSLSILNRKRAAKRPLFSKVRSYITGYGITTDQETSITSRIMILSIVPFILIQIPELIMKLSYVRKIITVVTLVVSIALLLVYFLYQVFQTWIHDRRLEYMKLEHLMARFLKHVEKQAAGKLLAADGTPNLPIIEGLFDKVDVDDNDNISPEEFKELIREIKSDTKNMDQNDIIDEVVKEFDADADRMISKDEFVKGFAKWLVKSKSNISSRRGEGSYTKKYIENLYQFENDDAVVETSLRIEVGIPNVSFITRLFDRFDIDKDNLISHQELRTLIEGIKFGKIELDMDDAVEELMNELDTNGDHMIDKEEFISGFTKFVEANHPTTGFPDTPHVKTPREKVKEVEEGAIENKTKAGCKAGLLLVLGISVLSLLAEPLIEVVQDFSNSVNLPSFFVSFV
ncbi:sodium/calcium exchanger NCL2-like [Papaver somniferum]|uniref:sodium/calcium exchanger NCL2-like n=1 Tax=Papaver somniferum TaxID=3469 RepID=UPI000E6F60CC|nr:sodium/calcium exchanger NCL2-like [Papaver somniferum]